MNKKSVEANRGILFIVVGLSGAGKTSIVNELILRHGKELNLKKIVSFTTRPPRPGEKNGQDYVFIDQNDFLKLSREDFFLETTVYNNNSYGTPSSINTDLNYYNAIIVTDISGALTLKQVVKKKTRLIFINTATLEIASQRLVDRDQDLFQDLEYRMKQNVNDLAFFLKNQQKFSFVITNSTLEKSLQELYLFIQKVLMET